MSFLRLLKVNPKSGLICIQMNFFVILLYFSYCFSHSASKVFNETRTITERILKTLVQGIGECRHWNASICMQLNEKDAD
jgi:hypothetical protein